MCCSTGHRAIYPEHRRIARKIPQRLHGSQRIKLVKAFRQRTTTLLYAADAPWLVSSMQEAARGRACVLEKEEPGSLAVIAAGGATTNGMRELAGETYTA